MLKLRLLINIITKYFITCNVHGQFILKQISTKIKMLLIKNYCMNQLIIIAII